MAQACGLRGRVDPEAIAARIQEHPCDHWIAALSALEIPVVRVRRNLRDLPDDPLIAPWVAARVRQLLGSVRAVAFQRVMDDADITRASIRLNAC